MWWCCSACRTTWGSIIKIQAMWFKSWSLWKSVHFTKYIYFSLYTMFFTSFLDISISFVNFSIKYYVLICRILIFKFVWQFLYPYFKYIIIPSSTLLPLLPPPLATTKKNRNFNVDTISLCLSIDRTIFQYYTNLLVLVQVHIVIN